VIDVESDDCTQRDEHRLEFRITAKGDDALQAVESERGCSSVMFFVLC
jgi:hypothetical protein